MLLLLLFQPGAISLAGAAEQRVSLSQGWNAVFLEVQPTKRIPNQLFRGTPISRVASHFPTQNTVEYISDPGEVAWKKEGWGIWYAPGRPDAFLSSLFSIQGNRSYLVYSESAYEWRVEGDPNFLPHAWKANSYNLVGFSLDPDSPPTFEKFFEGSRAHRDLKIYRLVDGRWRKLTDPRATSMAAGEAFWIYCEGKSNYQGPLHVSFAGIARQGLLFGPASGAATLQVVNQGPDPFDIVFETEGDLVLMLAIKSLQESRDTIRNLSVPLDGRETMSDFAPAAKFALTLQVDRGEMTESVQTGLLTITTSMGTRHYVPMAAARPALSE